MKMISWAVLVALAGCGMPDALTSTLSPARNLTGRWEGSATFTQDCQQLNTVCTYSKSANPPNVILQLNQNGNTVTGTWTWGKGGVTAQPADKCDVGSNVTSPISNGTVSSSRFTFDDVGGNHWSLNLTSDQLQGTVTPTKACQFSSKDVAVFRK